MLGTASRSQSSKLHHGHAEPLGLQQPLLEFGFRQRQSRISPVRRYLPGKSCTVAQCQPGQLPQRQQIPANCRLPPRLDKACFGGSQQRSTEYLDPLLDGVCRHPLAFLGSRSLMTQLAWEVEPLSLHRVAALTLRLLTQHFEFAKPHQPFAQLVVRLPVQH